MEIDRKPVHGPEAAEQQLMAAGDEALLLLHREGASLFVAIPRRGS